ncbi:MAG: DNA mismatch repair protein MutS, partial [Bacteroidales bacterium]|nr:DNA mismatch repair protein MutS [Bacteroidales bacterium]
ARAIVEYIHEYGHRAKTLFATHYHELNDLEELYDRVRNFHVAVKESGKQIIFLRKLEPGGTAHSFGIHVARMAGMPREVLSMAEKTLSVLEAKDAEEASQRQGAGKPVQLSLFQLDDPALNSLRDQLRKADLNNMTPLQAFDLLRDLKKELGL